jgi:hypothetical protein
MVLSDLKAFIEDEELRTILVKVKLSQFFN